MSKFINKKKRIGLLSIIVIIILISSVFMYLKNWNFTIKMVISGEGEGGYQLILKDKSIKCYSYNGKSLYEEMTITEQELQRLLYLAENLRETFEETNIVVFGGWSISLYYRGRVYARVYSVNDTKAFQDLVEEFVRLSPLRDKTSFEVFKIDKNF